MKPAWGKGFTIVLDTPPPLSDCDMNNVINSIAVIEQTEGC